jgi:glycosyltransferase involved in cell wall biosynthesis
MSNFEKEKIATKPRIALFGMGTLDAGNLGIPVMIDLFERLSNHYEITFYSFLRIDASVVPEAITVRQPPGWKIPGRVKYFLIALRWICDHFVHRYALIFAVSIYPTAWWAVILGKVFNRPVIVQLIASEGGTLATIPLGNLTIPWLKKTTLWVCSKAEHVVTVADYQKKIAEKNLVTRRPLAVLPLRINKEKFAYRQRSITGPVQFIQIAFYGAIKDQKTLFRAFAKVCEQVKCHLTVIGSGFDVPEVRDLLQQLKIGDHVAFTGFVPQTKLPQYLDKAHILFHTALFETGCAVIQEAMASGIVVAGTDVGILNDIGPEYAVIVPPGAADELAKQTLKVVTDPVLYAKIQQNAYRFISTYDAVWSYKNYQSFIQDVIDRKIKP